MPATERERSARERHREACRPCAGAALHSAKRQLGRGCWVCRRAPMELIRVIDFFALHAACPCRVCEKGEKVTIVAGQTHTLGFTP